MNAWLLIAVFVLGAAGIGLLLGALAGRRRGPRARAIVVFADGTEDQEVKRIVRSMGGESRKLPAIGERRSLRHVRREGDCDPFIPSAGSTGG